MFAMHQRPPEQPHPAPDPPHQIPAAAPVVAAPGIATPDVPAPRPQVQYQIFGTDMQVVQLLLEPQASVVAEKRLFVYCGRDVRLQAEPGGPGVMALLGRLFLGDGTQLRTWMNNGAGLTYVAFSSPFPGKIVAVDLAQSGALLVATDSLLCSPASTAEDAKHIPFGRENTPGQDGISVRRVAGAAGACFLHTAGVGIQKQLQEGEVLFVDSGCLVAYSETCKLTAEMSGSTPGVLGATKAVYTLKLLGPGMVQMQSISMARCASCVWGFSMRRSRAQPVDRCVRQVMLLVAITLMFFMLAFAFALFLEDGGGDPEYTEL